MLIYRRILTLCQSRTVWSMLDVMSKLSTPSLLPWDAKPVAGTNLPNTQACKLNLHFSIISFMPVYNYVIPMTTTTIENHNFLINWFNYFMHVVNLPWILWIIWKAVECQDAKVECGCHGFYYGGSWSSLRNIGRNLQCYLLLQAWFRIVDYVPLTPWPWEHNDISCHEYLRRLGRSTCKWKYSQLLKVKHLLS